MQNNQRLATHDDSILDVCVSSLRRGHASLLCVVPILTDDPRRESEDEPRDLRPVDVLQDVEVSFFVVCLTRRSLLVLTEFPCVVLWRPEALDCRVLIPPEALELAYP